jgi:hypothetical protein
MWLVASALSIGLAVVAIVVVKPHWLAREVGWMLGGAVALAACGASVQASFRRANQGSPPLLDDFEGRLLGHLDDARESRRLLASMAVDLEAQREHMDAEGVRSLDELRASLASQEATARFLDERALVLRRNLRLAVVATWVAGAIAALGLLEMGA